MPLGWRGSQSWEAVMTPAARRDSQRGTAERKGRCGKEGHSTPNPAKTFRAVDSWDSQDPTPSTLDSRPRLPHRDPSVCLPRTSGSSGLRATSWDLNCSFSDLVLPAPLGMALEPLQGACCPPGCSGPVQLLLSDGETETQNGSVALLPPPKP